MLQPMIVSVAEEPFQPMVTGRDVDRGAEPTRGLPGEHVIGNLTFEQAALLFGPYGTLVSWEGVEDRSCLTKDLLVPAKKLLTQPTVFGQEDCVMRLARIARCNQIVVALVLSTAVGAVAET